jgi:ATP-binding cassette subfamily F protein uup
MSSQVYLSLNECNLAFGKKKIFENISLSIHYNDRIAIVGKNGAGKTTLFNIINRIKEIDSGELWINPKITLSFLQQRGEKKDLKIFDYLSKFIDSKNEYFIEKVCDELKLDKEENVLSLSGGMLRKLNLASVIINDPDLLMLDEPTNHLDIESIKWLEKYLTDQFKGAFLVVSHNRSFLKNITNKVFWLDRRTVKVSPKGFSDFDKWKKKQIDLEERELENKKRFLAEEISWLSKGVTARRKRNQRRKDNIFNLKADYEKQRSEFIKSISKPNLRILENQDQGPNVLINFHNVNKSFHNSELGKEKVILKDFNYKFMKGERLGIIGKNGSGKSTFLNLITNNKLIDTGSIKIKKNINFSFFDQSGSQFKDQDSIKENMIPGGGDFIDVAGKKIHICGYLKNFLFEPKSVDKKVSLLSGGERNRLLLAKLLAAPKEILILDEPTNDLDIETIDLLIDFLKKYKGGVIVASHDMDFIDKVAQKFLLMDGNGEFEISLKKDFLINNKKLFNDTESFLNKGTNIKEKKNKPVSIDKMIKKILGKIENQEKLILDLSQKLEENTDKFDYSKNQDLIDNMNKAQKNLKELEQEWFELEEKAIRK